MPPAIIAVIVVIVLLVLVGIALALRRGRAAKSAPAGLAPTVRTLRLPPIVLGPPVQNVFAHTVGSESLEQRVEGL